MDGYYLQYLLGLQTDYAKYKGVFIDSTLPDRAFQRGWRVLCEAYKEIVVWTQPMVLPLWSSGKFEYFTNEGADFQNALYYLLTESWRAKLCRRCQKYFIAEKAAQIFLLDFMQ
jgi:hypothetical protein